MTTATPSGPLAATQADETNTPGTVCRAGGKPAAKRQAWIPGAPAPQGSKRHVGHGRLIESSKAVGPWRKTIAHTAHQHGGLLPPGPTHAHIEFVMPRPKATPKTRPTPPATKRPDLDKLTRAVFDALTGIWITDDSHITRLTTHKRIAEPNEKPGAHITLTTERHP